MEIDKAGTASSLTRPSLDDAGLQLISISFGDQPEIDGALFQGRETFSVGRWGRWIVTGSQRTTRSLRSVYYLPRMGRGVIGERAERVAAY